MLAAVAEVQEPLAQQEAQEELVAVALAVVKQTEPLELLIQAAVAAEVLAVLAVVQESLLFLMQVHHKKELAEQLLHILQEALFIGYIPSHLAVHLQPN
jgi:hypothetical protein